MKNKRNKGILKIIPGTNEAIMIIGNIEMNTIILTIAYNFVIPNNSK